MVIGFVPLKLGANVEFLAVLLAADVVAVVADRTLMFVLFDLSP